MLKVLLISANRVSEPFPVYPIGLDYLAGAISGDHQIRILDMAAANGLKRLEAELADFMPDVVGISIRNIDNVDITAPEGFINETAKIVRAVRSASRAKVILGGSGFTLFPGLIMEKLDAEYGVVGEGEKLAQLLAALDQDREPQLTGGLISKSRNPGGYPPPWPGPIKRQVAPGGGHMEHYLQKGGMLGLQTKRGCPFGCVYCTYPLIEGKKVRCFNPDQVAQEALELQEAGARFLFIVDSVFNSNAKHSLAVADAFVRAGLSIPWGAFFSPLAGRPDYYPRLARAGLSHVEFGTDAISPATLAKLHKPFKADDVFTAHQQALDAGLHVAHYLLLGGPGETRQTLGETLDNADKLDKAILFFFEGLRIYPDTGLFQTALEQGQVSPGGELLEPVFYKSPGLSSAEISEMVAQKARGRSNWVVGAGGDRFAALISMMHRQGHAGPLWEKLI